MYLPVHQENTKKHYLVSMLRRLFGSLLISISLTNAQVSAAIPTPKPSANVDLERHQMRLMKPEIVQLTKHVYAGMNYDLANIGAVVTEQGILIFDAFGEVDRAKDFLRDLRKISQAPIIGVVYSHAHGDHVGGVRAFIPAGKESDIPIYAHKNHHRYMREMTIPRGVIRGYMQMGYLLPKNIEGSIGAGAGKHVGSGAFSFLAPTVLIDDTLTINVGGIEVELFYAPGDLDDGLSAWVPSEGVLMAGDSAYPMMPIIATPRFEHGRRPWEAIDTVDHYRQLPVKHLLGGHIGNISGQKEVYEFLTKFRDAIQFLHDQTIRAANRGLDHDEAAKWVIETLPEDIKNDPNFTAHYQNLTWIIKGLYTKAVGWWNGDVVQLVSLSWLEKAERTIQLAGGREKIHVAVDKAFNQGESAWAMELANMLYQTDENDELARESLVNLMRTMAYESYTSNQRHYLLSQALILEGHIDATQLPLNKTNPDFLRAVSANTLFRSLGPKIAIENATTTNLSIQVYLSDKKQHHSLFIRRGIVEHREEKTDKADLIFTVDSETWLLLVGQHLKWDAAKKENLLVVKGSDAKFKQFSKLFN
tara:strand:- start:326 stop:2092 length:1767 start_codon:yes stop_codon:yes gene_type:complete